MTLTHIAVVDVILQNAAGEILLFERIGAVRHAGSFSIPGGRAEKGEKVIEVAVRETREEIGVEIDPADLEFVGLIDRPSVNASVTEPERVLHFFFRAQKWCGEPRRMEQEKHGEPFWVALDKLPENINPKLLEIIGRGFQPELVVM